MKKVTGLLLLTLGLHGCSDRAPNQAEIEAAVMGPFSGLDQCPGLSIENVRKTNGIKVDDSTYQIMATYDVRVIPVDGYQEVVDALQSRLKTQEEEGYRLGHELEKTRDCQGQPGNPSWLSMHPDCATDENRTTLQRFMEVRELAFNSKVELEQTFKAVKKEWGSDYCVMITGAGFGTGIFGFKNVMEVILKGGVNTFENTYIMSLTDNGWMALE